MHFKLQFQQAEVPNAQTSTQFGPPRPWSGDSTHLKLRLGSNLAYFDNCDVVIHVQILEQG